MLGHRASRSCRRLSSVSTHHRRGFSATTVSPLGLSVCLCLCPSLHQYEAGEGLAANLPFLSPLLNPGKRSFVRSDTETGKTWRPTYRWTCCGLQNHMVRRPQRIPCLVDVHLTQKPWKLICHVCALMFSGMVLHPVVP